MSSFKKMKNSMKPMIIVIIIGFIVSVFLMGVGSVWDMAGASNSNSGDIAFMVGKTPIGTSVVQSKAASTYEQMQQQVNPTSGSNVVLSRDLATATAVQQLLQEGVIAEYARKHHIKATKAQIDALYAPYIQAYTEPGLMKALKENNMTVAQLRSQLADKAIQNNAKTAITATYVPTSSDIALYYMQNAQAKYPGETLAQATPQIIKDFQSDNAPDIINNYIQQQIAQGNIKAKASQYANFINVPALTADGYTMYEPEFMQNFLSGYMFTRNIKISSDMAVTGLSGEVQALALAKSLNVPVNNDLYLKWRVTVAKNSMLMNYIGKMNVTPAELQTYFNQNKTKYAVPTQSYANVIVIPISDGDSGAAVVKANKVQQQIKEGKISFEKAMKKFSKGGPSSTLGPISKNTQVIIGLGKANPTIQNAALATSAGQMVVVSDSDAAYLIQVTKVVPPAPANFENSMAQVKIDYELQQANNWFNNALKTMPAPQVIPQNSIIKAMVGGSTGVNASGSAIVSGSSQS